jgi:hypothetical protein
MSSSSVENRIATLEQEVAGLKAQVRSLAHNGNPWWERIAGAFAGDEAFQKAMKLGRAYRRSQKAPPTGR